MDNFQKRNNCIKKQSSLKEVGCMDRIHLAHDGSVAGCCECGNVPLGSIKHKEFLDQLGNYQLLKDSAPCS
jgi:hypothetical protein